MVPVVEVKGARIPAIGLGTMTLKGDVCVEAVSARSEMGYRHIDTAVFYGNEAEVGRGHPQVRRRRATRFSSPPRCATAISRRAISRLRSRQA